MSLLSIIKKESLPKCWMLKNIGFVITETQYGTNEASFDNGNLEIVGMKDIQAGKILTDNLTRSNLTIADKKKFVLKKGDILINRTNSYDLVGKVGVYNSNKEVGFASYLVRLKIDKNIADTVFLNIWLNSYKAQGIIKRIATRAVSQANINPTEFKKFCIVPLPSLPEQKAIADLLSTWDEAIEKTERLIEAKEKRFKWLLNELIYLPAKNGKWKVVKLGKFISEKNESSTIHNQFPMLTSSRKGIFLQEDYFSKEVASTNNTDYKIISKGDFTYRSMSDDGIFVFNKQELLEKGLVSPAYSVFSIKNGDSSFFKYYLNSNAFRKDVSRIVQGGTRTSLKLKYIQLMLLPLPEGEEQKQIAECLNTARKEIDILKKLVEKYKIQKRGLMQKLLTGTWRVKSVIINKYQAVIK